ncbi:amino acid ABC transporter substrate-binding protein, PAAT family (TC 3.A.1.3.-) [Desulfacinum infernum DSM 9756]|uniref:Amino acid ABC transporter substrate-binding protein, PAAT family (TC 3.A.1.3.-) n=1 Tax=Desulfacinum infernum DSM 9756 TaxID=1121391 RepID=A0A1M4YL98_9BACT|nr:ABC transporter substrate-binding protein [Desulfacinum infernum]SHF06453.1 amino acid ABC transporter substrate-binding protein, PAAT family (TC 3.A.1.3.-) [Desulfacinum infernum DSM 9756]
MNRRVAIAVLSLCLLGVSMWSAGPVLAEEKVYVNGIDANYPPFTFIDASGKPDGLDIKAVEWIAKEMGFKVRHQPTDWAAIIPTLQAKKIDFIASGMSVTPERQEKVDFTIPYHKTVMVLVARKDSTLTVEEAMAEGRKMGVQRGTSEAKWIEDNLLKEGKKFELRHYDSAPLAMEDIVNGRLDTAAVSLTSAQEAMEKGLPLKVLGPYGQPDDITAYAVRKGDTELLNLLNEGLKRLMATPYWEELKQKYGVK